MTIKHNGIVEADLIELVTGEMLLYGLLGKMIYTVPEPEWINTLITEDVFSETPYAASQPDVQKGLELLQSWSTAANLDEVVKLLKVDHLNLFIGPGQPVAPPWESVYRDEDHLVFQEDTIAVRKWYLRFGLQVEKLFNEPDDHIGLEFAFLSHLSALALAAFDEDRSEDAAEIIGAQAAFLKEHVFQWAGYWCQDAIDNATTDFYRGAALLVRGALRETARRVGGNLVERKD